MFLFIIIHRFSYYYSLFRLSFKPVQRNFNNQECEKFSVHNNKEIRIYVQFQLMSVFDYT